MAHSAPDRAAPRGHRVVPRVQGGLVLVAEQPTRALVPPSGGAGAHEGAQPQGAAQARQANLQAHPHRVILPGRQTVLYLLHTRYCHKKAMKKSSVLKSTI